MKGETYSFKFLCKAILRTDFFPLSVVYKIRRQENKRCQMMMRPRPWVLEMKMPLAKKWVFLWGRQ